MNVMAPSQVARLSTSAARKFADKLRFDRGRRPLHHEKENGVVDRRISEGGELRTSAGSVAIPYDRGAGHHRQRASRPENVLIDGVMKAKGGRRSSSLILKRATRSATGRMFSFTLGEAKRYLEQFPGRARVAVTTGDITAATLGIFGLILVLSWLFA